MLAESKLEPFPVTVTQHTIPSVDHYKLALFVYSRLFGLFQRSLVKNGRNPALFELVGFEGTSATGSEEQLQSVISVLDDLILTEKNIAERLRAEARALEQSLWSLCSEIHYAIASRRLRKRCDLVTFI